MATVTEGGAIKELTGMGKLDNAYRHQNISHAILR
jgi:hypothetical protein